MRPAILAPAMITLKFELDMVAFIEFCLGGRLFFPFAWDALFILYTHSLDPGDAKAFVRAGC